MRKLLNITAIILLLFNGIGALYGGWNLITHPEGSSLQLSLELLKNTPFRDYLIPGVILFIANGLFSILAFTALILKQRNYEWYVVAQGIILTGWIVIQIFLIQTINFLHITLGLTAISLIITGLLLSGVRNLK